jgi:hypothetical protein
MSNHGYVTSCLGPVVDIQLAADVYREDRSVYSRLREGILGTETAGQKNHLHSKTDFLPNSIRLNNYSKTQRIFQRRNNNG